MSAESPECDVWACQCSWLSFKDRPLNCRSYLKETERDEREKKDCSVGGRGKKEKKTDRIKETTVHCKKKCRVGNWLRVSGDSAP